MSETPNHETAGYKAVINLYAALGVTIILSVIPLASAALAATLFFLGVLMAAYAVRGKAEPESFLENHTTYVIRTLWIASFLAGITIALSSFYMLGNIDYNPFEPCAQKLMNLGLDAAENASFTQIYPFIAPCVDAFVSANHSVFINMTIMAGGPVIVYMVYRFFHGLKRARGGYRIAKVKSWF